MVNSPLRLPLPPMAARAEPGADNHLALEYAVGETKRYAARIAKDPTACPMFPVVNEYNGFAETLCYVQGYLAGLVASTGQRPTKAEMDELVYDTLNDPKVGDMAAEMQADIRPVDMLCPPREF